MAFGSSLILLVLVVGIARFVSYDDDMHISF